METKSKNMHLIDSTEKTLEKFDFTVFLCGPSIASCKPSAKLRKLIKDELENQNFGVFLGEDDGVEELKKRYGLDAQNAEISYVDEIEECRAIVLIADSVGSYCELGLFNWLYACGGKETFSQDELDFFVILDKKYENDESYLNNGPIANLRECNAQIYHCNFHCFDMNNFLNDFLREINKKRARLAFNARRRK